MPCPDHSHSSVWTPPTVEELQAMLPQYEISAIIGRGGMGAVYKGRQARLDRNVAIKVLPETFTQGDDEMNIVARFEQEARAMAKLDHPAIVSVHDFGETDAGQLYFVMEFINGMDIQQYLREHGGRLPQEHALAITAHMLDALEYAHNHGIVHRDIKPANILLNHEGRVKIADFGLAKALSTGKEEDEALPALTMTNIAMGTPDFVAPEALDSDQTPDHRADIYAAGVMLYQMLTGTLPRGQFKRPCEHRPELDPRLDEIVSRSLQAHPDDRYSSASDVRLALEPIFTSPLTRLEGVEDESVQPTHTVTPVQKSIAQSAALPKPRKRELSKAPLYVSVGLATVLLIGGLVAVSINRGDNGDGGSASAAKDHPFDNRVGLTPQGKTYDVTFQPTGNIRVEFHDGGSATYTNKRTGQVFEHRWELIDAHTLELFSIVNKGGSGTGVRWVFSKDFSTAKTLHRKSNDAIGDATSTLR